MNCLVRRTVSMKGKKSNNMLDEMQDNKLLKIEEFGFWLVFWVLFAAILLQALMGTTLKELAGEIVALFAAGVYIAISSLKNGLWTRKYAPTLKANLITSAIPSFILGVLNAVRAFVILKKPIEFGVTAQIAAISVGAYIACFALLEVFRLIYEKRRRKLDDTEAEDER